MIDYYGLFAVFWDIMSAIEMLVEFCVIIFNVF